MSAARGLDAFIVHRKPRGYLKHRTRGTNGSETDTSRIKANEVFTTTELLEKILLELPERDMLLAQRVSMTFRNCIKGSIHIRRALFFELDPASLLLKKPRLNPLVWQDTPTFEDSRPPSAKALTEKYFENFPSLERRHGKRLEYTYSPIVVNELKSPLGFDEDGNALELDDRQRFMRELDISYREQAPPIDTTCLVASQWRGVRGLDFRSFFHGGSWQEMFISDPPIAVLLEDPWETDLFGPNDATTWCEPVKMGQLDELKRRKPGW